MKRRWSYWSLTGSLLVLFLGHAPEQISGREAGNSRKREPAEPGTTPRRTRYQPDLPRDPFLNPLLLRSESNASDTEEESRGEPAPGIAGTYIAQAVLIGILRKEEAETAIFLGVDRHAYFLHEGDRMFDGRVSEIRGESVVLVRETRLKNGTVLTQEVIKKLRPQ
jgi:hypothetical protein